MNDAAGSEKGLYGFREEHAPPVAEQFSGCSMSKNEVPQDEKCDLARSGGWERCSLGVARQVVDANNYPSVTRRAAGKWPVEVDADAVKGTMWTRQRL